MGKHSALLILMLGILLIGHSAQGMASGDSNRPNSTMSQRQGFTLYHNSRYGYSIEYPASFKKQPPPANNDGRTFVSPDGKATLIVYGTFNVFNDTAESAYHKESKEIKDPGAYKTCGKNWYVISWVEGSTVIYVKAYVGKSSLNTFRFTYPSKQSREYNPITTHLEATFRPGAIDD
jgi:hypothetical protein